MNTTGDTKVASSPTFCSATASPTASSSITSTPFFTVTPTTSLSTSAVSMSSAASTTTATQTQTPTPISKPTPTVTVFVNKNDVVINQVCSAPGDYQCPSGKCVTDPSKCTGKSRDTISQQITPSETTIPSSSKGKEVTVNVLSTSRVLVASLKFPSDTLQPGWVVAIAPSTLSDSNDTRVEAACGTLTPAELVTTPFQITGNFNNLSPPLYLLRPLPKVRDERDRLVTKFSKPFILSAFASFNDSAEVNHACFGYFIEQISESWRCSARRDFKARNTKSSDLYFLQSSINHFTTVEWLEL